MQKGKNNMTHEEHDKMIKEMGLTDEEHAKWHEKHDCDPDFWEKKSKQGCWKKAK